MSVWVCWVRYTVHLRGGATVNEPNSRVRPSDSTLAVTKVGPVKGAISTSTACLPLGSEGTACFIDCGQFGEAKMRVALVTPVESMETTTVAGPAQVRRAPR